MTQLTTRMLHSYAITIILFIVGAQCFQIRGGVARSLRAKRNQLQLDQISSSTVSSSLDLTECLLQKQPPPLGGGERTRNPFTDLRQRVHVCYQRYCSNIHSNNQNNNCDVRVIAEILKQGVLAGNDQNGGNALRLGGSEIGSEASESLGMREGRLNEKEAVLRMLNTPTTTTTTTARGFHHQGSNLLNALGGGATRPSHHHRRGSSENVDLGSGVGGRPKRWQYSDPLQACITTNCQGLRKVPFYQCAYSKCIAEEEKEDK